MQIKKSDKTNKKILIVISLIVISVVTLLLYLFVLKPQDSNSNTSSQSNGTETDKQQSDDIQNSPEVKTTAPNADKPAEPTPVTGSNKKQVQMIASSDQSNNTVYIRGGINYPVTGGSCYAQLSGPSGQSIRKESAVLSNPASTDCKTISIPASELTTGRWTATLHYTSDEFEGTSSEISFTL